MKAALFVLVAFASAEGGLEIKKDHVPDDCDKESKAGNYLHMHYTGTIDESSAAGEKGKKFDSSLDRGEPFTFPLGGGQVIKGWDQGLVDMCEGEKRTLIIPPSLGYGDRGAGADIPGGATLKFTVELVKIDDKAPPPPNIFAEIDSDADKKITADELAAWFKEKQGMTDENKLAEIMKAEDKDKNGIIDWDEFSGPKGTHDEL